MANYCVSTTAQSNGDHEVHDLASTKSCLPNPENRHNLGYHSSCSGAVAAAKKAGYGQANGCFYCSRACHTS